MVPDRKQIDSQAFSLMVLLCLIWASQQIALKAVATDIAPIFQISIRSGIAAVLVALLMMYQRVPLITSDGTLKPGLLVGALFALEFLLMGEGLRYTTASHIAVFLYTAPFFAALGLHWRLPEERLALGQWVGIALAFVGVAIAFLGPDRNGYENAPNMLLGDFLGVLAGAAWGATTVVVRCSALSNALATRTLLYQLIGGFLILLLATVVTGQTAVNFTPQVIASVAFQATVVSFFSFLAWFWLLRKYLASRIGVFSFMTPMFGIVLGVWLLGEPLDPSFLFGAVLVALGIVLVSGHAWLRQYALQWRAKR
ncbi:MAG: EamA family transporter [Pusillimonas sp.]|jgi:drug/metabolite transporter (DMT)-like permease|nr:EamA family transporter [Pusillimonas sp.]